MWGITKRVLLGVLFSVGIAEASVENSLLSSDTAIQFGRDYTTGKLTDATLIFTAAKIAEKELAPTKLMVNLALLYRYAPSLPDIMIACNQVMVELANKNEASLGGSSAYKIVYMLYQSQFDEQSKLRSDAQEEIIEDIMNRLSVLVGNDRALAKDLRRNFAVTVNSSGFGAYKFSEEWEPDSDSDE